MAEPHPRITRDPEMRSGQPCIRGMRITVDDVASYLRSGMTDAEVLDAFPYLVQEDLHAARSYAGIIA